MCDFTNHAAILEAKGSYFHYVVWLDYTHFWYLYFVFHLNVGGAEHHSNANPGVGKQHTEASVWS